MNLNDTALMMLSAAARRDDYAVKPPAKLKGAAGHRLIAKLQREGLIEEVAPHGAMSIWRRDEEGQAIGLQVTAAGLAAIGVDKAGAGPETKQDDAQTAATTRRRKGGSASGGLPTPKRRSAKQRSLPKQSDKDHASRNGGIQAASSQPASAQRAGSKQAHVIGMLSRPQRTTIAAIMSTTGWQQHSVRGFPAGAVRKRLGLTLISEVVGEERRYRIPGAKKAGSPARVRRRTVVG